MENIVKHKDKILIYGVILIATVIRIWFAIIHFTHYDDVGLVYSILANGNKISDKFRYMEVIPWTYAPLQCWIIALLVNTKFSYMTNLFLGRLPSLLFSIINILLVDAIYKKKIQSKSYHFINRLMVLVLIGFSWELVIYSAQCETYSIGITGMLILLYLFIDIEQKREIPILKVIICGAIVGYMQYQLFMVIFCFFISIFALFLKEKRKLLQVIGCGIVSFVLEMPVIFSFLKSGMFNKGISWNAGIQHQFIFNISGLRGGELIRYIFNFFISNTFTFFRSMFVYKTTTWWSSVVTLILIMLFIVGVVLSIKNNDKCNYFLGLVLLSDFILIIMGKLTFSPSRHMIIYIPLCIYYVGYTFLCFGVVNKTISDNWIQMMKCGIVIVLVVIFLIDIPSEVCNRKNLISEKKVTDWTEEKKPVFIGFYKDTFDLELMHIKGYSPAFGGIIKDGKVVSVGDKIIMYSRARTITDEDLKFFDIYLSQNKLQLLCKEEIINDTEVEYAQDCFWNYGNGYYYYEFVVVDSENQSYFYAPSN